MRRVLFLLAFALACAAPFLIGVDIPLLKDRFAFPKLTVLVLYCGVVCATALKVGDGWHRSLCGRAADIAEYLFSVALLGLNTFLGAVCGLVVLFMLVGLRPLHLQDWYSPAVSVCLAFFTWVAWSYGNEWRKKHGKA